MVSLWRLNDSRTWRFTRFLSTACLNRFLGTRHRLTVTLLKERFHQLLADDALLLAKRRSHHLVLAV